MTDYAAEFQAQMFDSFNRGQKQGDSQILVPRIVVCPSVYKKPCRLCELCKQAFRTAKGTPLGEKASNYYRKFRYYSNITFPATNPSEVIVFEYGKKILEKLMGFAMDPNSEYKGFLDPQTGRNVFIIKHSHIDKKKTTYDVEPRIQTSPLLDMSVLSKMYQLDKVLELIATKTVTPFYQSKLQNERTEVRFLPSWFGPRYSIFYMEVQYHYGFTADEFEAIQRGELNPFIGEDGSTFYMDPALTPKPEEMPKQRTIAQGQFVPPSTFQVPQKAQSPWEQSGWEQFGGFSAVPGSHPIGDKGNIVGTNVSPKPQELQPTHEKLHEELPVADKQKQETIATFPSCYGKEYNPEDPECSVSCEEEGWGAGCKLAMEAAERRKAAKRLFKS